MTTWVSMNNDLQYFYFCQLLHESSDENIHKALLCPSTK